MPASNIWTEVSEYLQEQTLRIHNRLDVETVELHDLPGRTLAETIHSPVHLPAFPRAMMDGVAVAAEDWTGKLPIVTRNVGDQPEIHDPAGSPDFAIGLPVATGNFVPPGYDAVVPMEWLQSDGRPVTKIHVGQTYVVAGDRKVQPGLHVACVGEDITMGEELAASRRVVRPHDLGLFAACGITQGVCFRRPRVCVAMTGNEIVCPGAPLKEHQIYDANGPVLQRLATRDGGDVTPMVYLPDDAEGLRRFLNEAVADVIILCGGTSVGARDFAAGCLGEVGRLAFHGLPIRPGRPVGFGNTPQSLVFLLPGNPVACQFTYDLLVGPVLRSLAGRTIGWPYKSQWVQVSTSVPSELGRLDYLRVTLEPFELDKFRVDTWLGSDPTGFLTPLPVVKPLTSGRASNLSTISRASGFVLIPPELSEWTPDRPLLCYWYDQ